MCWVRANIHLVAPPRLPACLIYKNDEFFPFRKNNPSFVLAFLNQKTDVLFADVVKLVDTPDLGSGASGMGVRVPPSALCISYNIYAAARWPAASFFPFQFHFNPTALEITKVNTGDLLAEIHIRIAPDDYRQSVQDAIKAQGKRVSVPGFREGKVPFNLLRKMAGLGPVIEQVNKIASNKLFEFLKENNFSILGQPIPTSTKTEADYDLECNNTYDFNFEIGLSPEVTFDLSKVSLPAWYEITVDDDFINKEIDQYQTRFGESSSPESVGSADVIFGRAFEVDENSQAVEGGFERTLSLNPARIGNDAFFANFVGMAIDDIRPLNLFDMADEVSKIGDITFMEDEEVEALRGKSLHFQLRRVSRYGKADLDAAFFKKVAEAYHWESAEEEMDENTFRETLRSKIAAELEDTAKLHFSGNLQKAIVEAHAVPVPEGFLSKWLLTQDGYDEAKVAEEMPKLKDSIVWSLISEQIQKEQNFQVSDEEIQNRVLGKAMDIVRRAGMDPQAPQMESYYRAVMDDDKRWEEEYRHMISDMVMEYIVSQVTTAREAITATKFVEQLK